MSSIGFNPSLMSFPILVVFLLKCNFCTVIYIFIFTLISEDVEYTATDAYGTIDFNGKSKAKVSIQLNHLELCILEIYSKHVNSPG